MISKIDSHHHLWHYSAKDYPWMGDTAGALKRDFSLPELTNLAGENAISGFVTVQARQTVEETAWLLDLATKSSLILGVVGWVPLREASQLSSAIDVFSPNKLLKGVRHVIQDELDDDFILGAEFNQGIGAIGKVDWVYDILIYAKHLKSTIKFVDRHPNQLFVLDHIAKPTVWREKFDVQWSNEIRELAKRENVACKFSGVATEVRDSDWDVETIRPYWEVALEAFGTNRLMYGSDWPVCLLRTEYSNWKSAVDKLAQRLTVREQAAIWSENARRIYKLGFETVR